MSWKRRVKRKLRTGAPPARRDGTVALLVPGRPPGSARAAMFFDEYPRFYETSQTAAHRGRLNLRYEAIFAENRDIFAGARVLDVASHDGRWSLAALKTGAAEVVGVEARDELVRAARENLERYANGSRYRFVAGDVFEVLSREQIEADVVLCLGFLYHTLRYNELMRRIRDIDPRHLVIDTAVLRRRKAATVTMARSRRRACGASASRRGENRSRARSARAGPLPRLHARARC